MDQGVIWQFSSQEGNCGAGSGGQGMLGHMQGVTSEHFQLTAVPAKPTFPT